MMLLIVAVPAFGQTDRKEVRHGNREFKKDVFQTAEIDYKKALLKDSLSNAANFNLGNTYYRMENYSEADRYYSAVSDSLDRAGHGAESYFNQGDSSPASCVLVTAIQRFSLVSNVIAGEMVNVFIPVDVIE